MRNSTHFRQKYTGYRRERGFHFPRVVPVSTLCRLQSFLQLVLHFILEDAGRNVLLTKSPSNKALPTYHQVSFFINYLFLFCIFTTKCRQVRDLIFFPGSCTVLIFNLTLANDPQHQTLVSERFPHLMLIGLPLLPSSSVLVFLAIHFNHEKVPTRIYKFRMVVY